MSPASTTFLILAVLAGAALWVVLIQLRRERARNLDQARQRQQRLDSELRKVVTERNNLLDALDDALLLVDDAGRIRFANTAAHRLSRMRQLVDRPLLEVLIDPPLAKAVTHCLRTGEPVQTRITLTRHADAESTTTASGVRVLTLDAARLPSAPDTPALTRVIIRDITAEHQTEQIRKDFVANASHELRTPMAIISGYLENLLDNDMIDDTPTARRFLTVMRKHSDRMSRIIEDMLVISRLESGEENPLRIKPFRLDECVRDILERLESVIQAQSAAIRLDIAGELTLHGDRFYWFQALFNLIENALKQNPRPGLKIEIGASEDDDGIRVWVSDNGVGIPRADLAYIFRRFYRVDKQHSQQEIKGTGLGLSIVKRAIEAHGGTIRVSSTPGVETRFLIELPKSQATGTQATAAEGLAGEPDESDPA